MAKATVTEDLKSKNILVIVESPNKVSHVSEYLKKAGYKNLKVLASVGHVMELRNSGKYFNSGVDPENEFALDIAVSSDKKDVVTKLSTAAKNADIVYLMSDPDREGFVIAWSLIKFLKLPKTKYRRAITHEITPKAVVNAIENPIAMDDNLVNAGLARLAIDKMIGFRMSPIAKTYVGAKSVGRCQSAGLKLIVDREKEIQNFKPEEYYDLYLHFSKNKTEFKAKYIGTDAKPLDHMKSKNEVTTVVNECIGKFVISDISKHEKQESPKPPFCTASFQQEVASKIGLSVKDAMSCAQKLFEAGNITYMRTDDTDISPEFIPTLKAFIETAYGKKAYVTPRKGKKQEGAQEGHECLRVTDPNLTPEEFNKLNPNNLLQKIYKIIWQRTIAAALPNAVISETSYNIQNNGHNFSLVSKEVIDEGYRKVYSYKDEDAGDEVAVKETFKNGEEVKNTSLEGEMKKTQPKPRFKEATFIKELQKREIGRPSTYATIVETVLSPTRGYCALDDKKCMVPTDRGMQLIGFLDRSFSNIINIDWTKDMEAGLDDIATGKKDRLVFLNEFYNTLEDTVKSNTEFTAASEQVLCPKCGAPMVIRRSRFGKLFYGCSQYPKCNGITNVN